VQTDEKSSVLIQMREMFPDQKTHLNTILKLYKFLFPRTTKTIWEKTPEDLLKEISDTKISLELDKMMENHVNEMKEMIIEDKMLARRISLIGAFVDTAYLYYVWHYDNDAPIYKLPNNLMKFKFITEALGAPKDSLNACFEKCISDEFIKDTRNSQPPFMMRTELSKEQIIELLRDHIQPIFKEILNALLKFNRDVPSAQL